MKQLLFLFVLTLFGTAYSQNFENKWSGHFSYTSVKSISQGNDRVYAAAENAIFTYDLSTHELATLSSINGLSGEFISTIYYSESFGLLVIGYENGLIEVVIDGDDDILTVVDILDKQTIPPSRKRINHLSEYNGNLYISAGFGISVFNLEALEFGDSYFIGDLGTQIEISQSAVREPFIYATSPEGGVFRAEVANDDLIDYQSWTNIAAGNYQGIQTLNNEVYTLKNNKEVYLVPSTGPFLLKNIFSENVVDFLVNDDLLTVTSVNKMYAYSAGFTEQGSIGVIPDFEYELQSGLAFNNYFYMGTTEIGMLITPFNNNQAEQLLPDGPILNQPFAIDTSPGQLWVGFGDIDVNFNPFPLSRRGISNLKDGIWTNIPYEDLEAAVGGEVTDIVKVIINPENAEETFMSSYQKGLLKIDGLTPTVLFNENNSPLTVPPNLPAAEIRIYGSDFDRQGNLWFVQSRINEGLIKRSSSGGFERIDISAIIDAENEIALSSLAVSREGYVFFGATENGLIGYNPTTGALNKIGEGIGSGNLSTNNIRALEFDNQNRLWIGSLNGLRVLYNVGGFFEEGTNTDAQAIIILDGDVPQELLYEQSITDIEVDGSNNKWISTATSGVFYLSSNGQETLLRFTKNNSPLPTNNIQDIAIDEESGVVYFATKNGLVAYNGTSTAPREDLSAVYAYPNPVRPGYTGFVTIDGLTARANVKITDLEGNLVFETTSEGGSVIWDTTAFGRYRVATGVYLVLVTTKDAQETKVTKIMIVR